MEELTYRPPREPLVAPGAIECHVHDMTATASADVSLQALQAKLAEHGQWLPIDGDATQSVGSLVACDSTGPLRLGYGAWRDLLLGVQFTNGRGELITAGGRTVKNVAGYDLTKFMVGQRGVFGSLVTITTRTYRRPAGAILARHAPDVGIVSKLIPTSLRPQWAVLTHEHLLCGYLGDEPTLAFYRGSLGRSEPLDVEERSLEHHVEHRASLWNVDAPVVFRASVPPARLGELATPLAPLRWAADAAFGIVVGTANEPSELAALREDCAALGGSLKAFHGAFGPAIELSTTPAERQIIERLKHAFDPDRKLAPLPWQTP
ncbi:MAG TPA: FAD-binding oxidoreductase [Tepidisphaeraceae bacterium]|jgi:FAD/FMN-containing dehydrogenase